MATRCDTVRPYKSAITIGRVRPSRSRTRPRSARTNDQLPMTNAQRPTTLLLRESATRQSRQLSKIPVENFGQLNTRSAVCFTFCAKPPELCTPNSAIGALKQDNFRTSPVQNKRFCACQRDFHLCGKSQHDADQPLTTTDPKTPHAKPSKPRDSEHFAPSRAKLARKTPDPSPVVRRSPDPAPPPTAGLQLPAPRSLLLASPKPRPPINSQLHPDL